MSVITGLSPVALYQHDLKDEAKSAADYAKTDATVTNYTSSFEKDAVTITSAAELMKNYKALSVVLGAYGLGSIQNSTALVKDLLTQDPTSSKSVSAKSGNAAWTAFAKAFSAFNTSGSSASTTSPFADQSAIDSIVTKYEEKSYETALEAQQSTSGVGNALYFTRTMTTGMSVNQIMSDSTLLKVVETVSGYNPTQFGVLDYDEQKRLIEKTYKASDFSSAASIQKYAERYLAILQFNPQTVTKPATMLSLYGSDGSSDPTLSLFGITSSGTSLVTSLFG
ncbi:DUF1217 domain-containing protein [Acetobacter sp.]|jgi:hypothetical protein|uniref:DUF1217 domain-containing protein n=1 Tax=Acetobacter sp. TaxID=440 RepID=UPI0025C06C16|nr:DUF1217 domain-containing protein [Acetobacter sp.]MCH4090336.1 DUF1217 domain-containing protein [Acetobacter sp.]MCI1299030.1 DUF1217 domain-containing protein [Acetobacter sp.]MCI1315050.1 DUF1217 domain-containing protein [Acetobacter sp.]